MEQLEERRLLALIAWDGGGDGATWRDAQNWVGDVLPGAADDVQIDVAGDITVRLNGSEVIVNSVDIRETLRIDVGMLTVAGSSTVEELVMFSGAKIGGAGDLVVGGGSWDRARFEGSGKLTIAPDATVRAAGNNGVTFMRPAENFGTFEFSRDRLTLGQDFVNRSTGTIVFFGDAGTSTIVSGDSAKLINEGTVRKTGDGTLTFFSGVFFENRGVWEQVAGEVELQGGGSTTTTFDIPSGATLKLFSEEFVFAGATAVTGTGRLELHTDADFSSAQFLFQGSLVLRNSRFTFGNTIPSATTIERVEFSTVTLNADQTFDSVFVNGSTFTGPGDMVLSGTSTLNRTTFEGDGSLSITSDSQVRVTGNSHVTFARLTENFGTLDVSGVFLTLGADFVNRPGGTIDFTRDSSGPTRVLSNIAGTSRKLINEGTVRSTGAAGVNFGNDAFFENRGTWEQTAGEVEFAGGGSTTTVFDVPVGTTLKLSTKEFVFSGATALTGTGRLDLRAPVDMSSTQFAFAGVLNLDGATVTFGNVFAVGLVVEQISFSTVTLTVDQVFDSIFANRSTFTGPGDIVLSGTSTLIGATFEGDGSLSISSSSQVRVMGNSHVTFARLTENFGTLDVSGVFLTLGADFVNRPGGTIDFARDSSGPTLVLSNLSGTSRRLTNEGTVWSTGAAGVQVSGSVLLENKGLTRVEAGTLSLRSTEVPDSSGTYSIAAGATLEVPPSFVLQGGRLEGAGTLLGDLTNSGTVAPGEPVGSLTIDGDFVQQSDGELDIAVSGVETADRSQLVVTGAADVAGRLVGRSVGGFVASDQQLFTEVLTAPTVTGAISGSRYIGTPLGSSVVAEVGSTAIGMRVVYPDADSIRAVRDALNAGIESLRNRSAEFSGKFDTNVGGLPFVSDSAGVLTDLIGIPTALAQFDAASLKTVTDDTPSFDVLRTAFAQAGYEVLCVAGEEACGAEQAQLRLLGTQVLTRAEVGIDDLAGTPLDALAAQTTFAGQAAFDGTLEIERLFGVDEGGFYSASDSTVAVAVSAAASIAGQFDLFSLGAEARIAFRPLIRFQQLDVDGDGKIRESELSQNLQSVSLMLDRPLTADLTLDGALNFLDFVDVDPALPNRANGGDPFIIRATAGLVAHPAQFNLRDFSGLDVRWHRFRAANPDIDGDGELDYTEAVFLKNAILLGQEVLSGRGILDYFRGVLGVENAAIGDAVPRREPTELSGSKLPVELLALPNELASVAAINQRLVEILEIGPPTPGELELEQRLRLRDWFFADPQDKDPVTGTVLPEKESIQFRLAKIAKVRGRVLIPDQLVELVSPIEDDVAFERLFIEALTDWVRWHAKISTFGYNPIDLLKPTAGEANDPSKQGLARLQAAEAAIVEGFQEVVQRALARAQTRTDASGATDVDRLLQDTVDALAWSGEAARFGSRSFSGDIRSFDERAEIEVSRVIEQLPFTIKFVDPPTISGNVNDAEVTVRAGLFVEKPAGGFFPPIFDPVVTVRVEPANEVEGLTGSSSIPISDLTSPTIARPSGPVDVGGEFSTGVVVGEGDQDISLRVSALLDDAIEFDQQNLLLKGPVSISLTGRLPVVPDSDDVTFSEEIFVPVGHDVELAAVVSRGNRVLRNRMVNFFIEGPGRLRLATGETGVAGTAYGVYSPPLSGRGTAVVGVAYFEDGALYRDTIEVVFGPGDEIAEQFGAVFSSNLQDLPPSIRESLAAAAIEAILAAQDEPVSLIDLSTDEIDGVIPFLRTWFEESVALRVNNGTASDDALKLGLRDFYGWRAYVQQLGLSETDVVTAENFAAVEGLIVTGLQNAVARDRDRFLASPTSLNPLYEALEWTATAQVLGIDESAAGLAPDDIVGSFRVTIELSDVALSGTAEGATLSGRAALRIDGQPASFDVPVDISLIPQGTSRVAESEFRVNKEGVFSTSASIGERDDSLRVTVQAGIVGFDLARTEVAMPASLRLEVAAFNESEPTRRRGDFIQTRAADVVVMEVDLFRGNVAARGKIVRLQVVGGGVLGKTSFDTSTVGGDTIKYYPPLGATSGTAVVRLSVVDRGGEEITREITIAYEAAQADAGGLTSDGRFARDRVKLVLDTLPRDELGRPIIDNEAKERIGDVLRDWFRGIPERAELASVTERFEDLRSSGEPAEYDAYRVEMMAAIGNYFDWQVAIDQLEFQPLSVLAAEPLENRTPSEELAFVDESVAALLRSAIERQDGIVTASNFDFKVMQSAAREVIEILSFAAQLGIDDSSSGLDLTDEIRSSLAFPTPDETEAELAIEGIGRGLGEIVTRTADGRTEFSEAFLDAIRPELQAWFVQPETAETTVVSQLEELQPGSPSAPADYRDYANRLTKAVRNWVSWRHAVARYKMSPDEVLGSLVAELARARELVRLAMVEAVRRVGADSQAAATALPANPSVSQVEALLEHAARAADWQRMAESLGFDTSGQGLDTPSILSVLSFGVDIIAADTGVLLRDESTSGRPELQSRMLLRIQSRTERIPSELIRAVVVPGGSNGVEQEEGATAAGDGRFATRISLGANEAAFRYRLAATIHGLEFAQVDVVRGQIVTVSLVGAVVGVGDAALVNQTVSAIDGESVRVQVTVQQGNFRLPDAIVLVSVIGEGVVSPASVRTDRSGTARFTFTPPADKIGLTKLVVTYFQEDVLRQAEFDVAYTSSREDATVVPRRSPEQVVAIKSIRPILQRAVLDEFLGNPHDDVAAEVVPAMRTWYFTGVKPRIAAAGTDTAKLEAAASEFLEWLGEAALLGIEDAAPDNPYLSSEVDEGRGTMTQLLESTIDANVTRAVRDRDGDAAIKAIETAEFGLLNTLIDQDDASYALDAVLNRLKFSIVTDRLFIDDGLTDAERLEGRSAPPDATFELVIEAHVELDGVPTATVPNLPVQVLPLGFAFVGNSEGALVGGSFRTPISYGEGDRKLRARIALGSEPYASVSFAEVDGPLELVTIASLGTSRAFADRVTLGRGQSAAVGVQIKQGRGLVPEHQAQFKVVGEGTLATTVDVSDRSGVSVVEFTPPGSGAGTSRIQVFVQGERDVVVREITIDWDAAADPVPASDPAVEAAGLLSGSIATEILNAASVPGTGEGAGDTAGITSWPFTLTVDQLTALIDGEGSLAEWNEGGLELIELVDFDTLVGFFSEGIPQEPAELVRVALDFSSQGAPNDLAFATDFAGVLPPGVTAQVNLLGPELDGRLVFGLDTSTSPFYVLTQPDELGSASTPIDVGFGFDARVESSGPLLGTPDEPILTLERGFVQLDSSFEVDSSAVARDPELDGKLRFDNLSELRKLRAGFGEDPLDRLQAVARLKLSIPGIKESSASDRDAVIPLLAAASRVAPGEPFVFELTSGEMPEIDESLRSDLASATPVGDDETAAAEATIAATLEENDTPGEVAAQPIFGTASRPSPNLGVRSELLTIPTLALLDAADWFRFETTRVGSALSFASVEFDARRGDLDLALYRQLEDGSRLRVAADVSPVGDQAMVSLVGMPAGVYFVKVYDDAGGRQPHYAFRYNPPQAPAPAFNLALGTVDLRDLRFAGSLDSDGRFQVDVSGTLLIPQFKKSDGTSIPIGVSGSMNNDEFSLGGSIDLTGETLAFGENPKLLEVSDLFTEIDVTIPFDGGDAAGGILVRAGSAIITPELSVSAMVLGDRSDPDSPIPGLTGSIDVATGKVDLDLYRVQLNLAEIVQVDALPGEDGSPAVRFSFDPEASPTDDLLVFESLTASLPALAAPGAATPSATLRDFGIRHDGALFLGGIDLAIPSSVLESLGLPPILDIQRIGIDPVAGERITGDTLARLAFSVGIDATLDLTEQGIPVTASVGNLEIDMRTFDGGNLLGGITFDSIAVDIGTRDDPIELGALSFFGGFLLERFDPTPNIPDDEPALLVRVNANAEFASIGLGGEILFTEYGPISAGLELSFGESGIPLGPVALYEARALLLFNEEVPELPLNDPLKLIEGVEEGAGTFDLSRFRYDSSAALREATLEKARQFIRDNRARTSPIATWNTPFIIAMGGLLGPVGQPRSTAAFLADVTIGANIDPDPDAPEVVLFGLGEAFVPDGSTPDPNDRLGLGVVGAVLELSDPVNPKFQFAFATPSPGSELTDQIPAEIKIGATFIKEGDDIRLDVVGDVQVLDILNAQATGSLRINETGMFGQIEIVVGGGVGGTSSSDPTLDLDGIGTDLALAGKFELMFNLTNREQTVTRPDRSDPARSVSIDIPAATTRLYVSGMLEASAFEIEGAFLMQVDPLGVRVGAVGELAFGTLGQLNVRGGLLLVSEERNSDGAIVRAGGVAGRLEVVSSFQIPGLLTFDGSSVLGINSFGETRNVLVPTGLDGGTETIAVDPGFLLRISGSDPSDPGSVARLSIFPADAGGNRFVGLDFTGRFEVSAQPNRFSLSFAAGAEVIFNNSAVLSADVSADLAFETILVDGGRRDVVSGGFSGTVRAGDTELANIEGEIDRFGCLRTNIPLLEELPLFSAACSQRVFVPYQQFDESAGDTALRVELTSPAKKELTITVATTRIGANGAASGTDYTLSESVTVPAGTETILVPLSVVDDDLLEPDRGFHVRVAARYAGAPGVFQPADPLFEDIQGDVTIVDDDAPPIGPPVVVEVIPSENQALTSLIEPGEPITTRLAESDGPLAFALVAPQLQRQDQVVVRARLVRGAGNESLRRDFVDVTPVFGERTVTLQGREPVSVVFLQVDDDVLEFPEEVRVEFEIVRPAVFSPSTILANSRAAVTILNDDPERPADTILFYSFDGDVTPIPGPGGEPVGADYAFTDQPTFRDDRVIGTSLAHSTDATIEADGIPKLDADFLFDPVTPAAGSDEWSTGTTSQELLENGGAESGLGEWFRAAGNWSVRTTAEAFAGDRVFESAASSSTESSVLEQGVSLGSNLARRIAGHEQRFSLSGKIQPRLSGTVGRLEVEYFDSRRQSLEIFSGGPSSAANEWNRASVSGIVPTRAASAVVRLVASSSGLSGRGPVLFDDVSFSLADPPFFEFGVLLDDVERPLETAEDFEQALGLAVDGIQFWQSAAADGPRGWELRSSVDGFKTPIATGRTSDDFELATRSFSLGDQPLRPIGQAVVFRLYGIGGQGGDWTVDNIALTGSVRPLSTFALPPVAVDDTYVLVRDQIRDGISLSVLDNDFDPNGAGMKIVGVETTSRGRVELVGGPTAAEGFRIKYTPRDPDFVGRVQFRYVITEHGSASDGFSTGVVTLEIIDVRATADAYSAVAGTTLSVSATDGVLANDELAGLAVERVIAVPTGGRGSLSVNDDGSFTYTPDPGTQSDRFEYFFVTTSGIASRSTQVRLTVVPDAARRATDDVYAIREDERLEVIDGGVQLLSENGEPVQTFPGVLDNDVRGSGASLVARLESPPQRGEFSLLEDGRFSYAPPANFSGAVQFQYRIGSDVSDPVATAVINVVAINDRPIADPKTLAVPVGSTREVIFKVTGTDVESNDDDLQIVTFTQPARGRVDVVAGKRRTFRYVPPAGGFSERTSFQFNLSDGDAGGLSEFATVTLDRFTVPASFGGRSPLKGSGFNGEIREAEVFLDPDGSAVDLAGLASLANSELRTNVANVYDINDDGFLTPRDALLVIEKMARAFPAESDSETFYFDVDGNLRITPRDALLVVEALLDPELAARPLLARPDAIGDVVPTGEDGSFLLPISEEVDADGDGVHDASEGRLVLRGGTVVATGLPTPVAFSAPANATVISAFSTLLVALTDSYGMSIDDAQVVIERGLDLPGFDALHTPFLQEALGGSVDAPLIYRVSVQVVDTAAFLAHYLAKRTGRPLDELVLVAFGAIAGQFRNVQGNSLADPAVLRLVLRRGEAAVGLSSGDGSVEEWIAALTASNRLLADVPAIGGAEFLESLAGIEKVLQGTTIGELHSLLSGRLSSEEFLRRNTGDDLATRVAAAEIGNVAAARVSVRDVRIDDPPLGQAIEATFIVTLDRPSLTSVEVGFATADGTLSSTSGDYVARSGVLQFGPGETEKVVTVEIASQAAATGGTFELVLDDVTGAVFENRFATVEVVVEGSGEGGWRGDDFEWLEGVLDWEESADRVFGEW